MYMVLNSMLNLDQNFIALLFPLSASPLLFPHVSAAGTQAQNPF